ncbi:hypothetical protein SNEBB_001293 [Seison nebaliae]|nr:hypothetical protein SNEBB_001293 [Seison nebaliae]
MNMTIDIIIGLYKYIEDNYHKTYVKDNEIDIYSRQMSNDGFHLDYMKSKTDITFCRILENNDIAIEYLKERIKGLECQLINCDVVIRNNGCVNQINMSMLRRFAALLKFKKNIRDCRVGFCHPKIKSLTDNSSRYMKFCRIPQLDIIDEIISLIFYSTIAEFHKKHPLKFNANLPLLLPKYFLEWSITDLLSILQNLLETGSDNLNSIYNQLEVVCFLAHVKIDKNCKLIHKYFTELLGEKEIDFIKKETKINSFIYGLSKRNRIVGVDEIETEMIKGKREKILLFNQNTENIMREMRKNIGEILNQIKIKIEDSYLIDNLMKELEIDEEKNLEKRRTKDRLTDFIEDCLVGYFRQLFVINGCTPILQQRILENNKDKEKIQELYDQMNNDEETNNTTDSSTKYNSKLLREKLGDLDLEMKNAETFLAMLKLETKDKVNSSNIITLEHICRILLLYYSLQPDNYLTVMEYVGILLLE